MYFVQYLPVLLTTYNGLYIVYCNKNTIFHYIVWCEAADKIIDVANSHDSRLIYIIPQIHNKINFNSPSVCNLLQSKYT